MPGTVCLAMLSMALEHEKFHKTLNWAHKKADCLEERDGEYIDSSLASKGLTVKYRDNQYKKKVKLTVDAGLVAVAIKSIRIS